MRRLGILLALTTILTSPALAAADATDPAQIAQSTVDKSLAYLKSQQKPDFGWQDEADPPGITALVLRAFISDPQYNVHEAFIQKGFEKLLSYQLESGGIYKDILACYNTAIAISALAESKDPDYHAAMEKALNYLRTLQWTDKISGVPDELHVASTKDVKYGGFGYGKRSRPDLSNTQMALDALHDAGVKSSDPTFAAALTFVSRCQNFSETNNQPWAGDDGGFIYTPADGGNSAAGEYFGIGGRRMLRSYGSMTYAGLKSMIYAGLTHDDPRVKAAWDWISKNFTVDENPGMSALGPDNAQGGLYYYFYTMDRALAAYGQPVIVDPNGGHHDWRRALINKLAALQRPDGSFVGQRKWMEDNPILVTSYCVLVLEGAKKDLAAKPSN
jgi:squalene-hopene/tetraprenyl-beta-curcumene cyclase